MFLTICLNIGNKISKLILIVLLILQLCPFSDETLRIFDTIDNIFVYVYWAEIVLKLLGMGIQEYFNDNWNIFDFILAILSLIMGISMSVIRISKTLISSKRLRFLGFSERPWWVRLTKWFKKSNFNTLGRTQDVINKAFMWLSGFKRITLLMVFIFYIYAVIGTEFLTYSDEDYDRLKEENPNLSIYEGSVSRSFQTFRDSFFWLFQILTESSWHLVILYHEIFHGVYFTAWLLIPFHFLITFILRSILLGMTWEVFGVINAQNNEEDDYLVQSIKVKGDFKVELVNNEFPNDRYNNTLVNYLGF